MTPFFGRNAELKKLKQLKQKKSASLVVIKGRRRIGKSRLAEEFGKDFKTSLFITGIPPSRQLTAQEERDDFSRQMSRILKMPPFQCDDWGDLFYYLSKETTQGEVLIVLDEINWMGSKDHTFLGKLKSAWDQYFSKNSKLVMILCGSLSGWIEKNILTSTGFIGRISKAFTLHELPIHQCNQFWSDQLTSPYEKFKLLAVTGGIPKYLEEIIPHQTAEENIRNLCFQRDGYLFREFEQLFHDLFSHKSEKYKKILHELSSGPKDLKAIYQALNLKKTGYIVSEYLDDLEEGGFIKRDYTWNLSNGKQSKLSLYRLSDNYARFYLKYIESNKNKIERSGMTKIPSYESIMGLQFENLVLNNRKSIYQILGIDPSIITYDNPYFQKSTSKRKGCQIDYMIQTEHEILYLIEIKFSKNKVAANVIQETKEKIQRLELSSSLSIRPVLIHVNGLSKLIIESNFFTHIINFSDLLYL